VARCVIDLTLMVLAVGIGLAIGRAIVALAGGW
jgi:hypothetical protein